MHHPHLTDTLGSGTKSDPLRISAAALRSMASATPVSRVLHIVYRRQMERLCGMRATQQDMNIMPGLRLNAAVMERRVDEGTVCRECWGRHQENVQESTL